MKKIYLALGFAGSLFFSQPCIPQENSIPPIPEGKYLMSVKTTPTGIFHEYDTDEDDFGDYQTFRRVKLVNSLGVMLHKPGIYRIDSNRNHRYECHETFLDKAQDGINGNEVQCGKPEPAKTSRGKVT